MELDEIKQNEGNAMNSSVSEFDNDSSSSDVKKIIQNIIIFLKRCKVLIRKYIYIFLIIAVSGAGIALYLILNKEITYKATLVFVLQEEAASSQISNMADPLSSYLLTRATSQSINLDRMKEISYSQKLLSNLLFNKCIINGKDNYLINHILSIYYNNNDSYFKNYRGLNGLNRNQYRVFSNVSGILRNSIIITQTKAGGYNVSITMKNEELTKVTAELFYQNLSNFYIDKTTEKAQGNYIFLRNRLDSVRNLLYSSEYQVANFEDRSRNLLLSTARVPQVRQQRNTEFYQALYGELIKTFENSKVALNNISPLFQLLQRPYYPLSIITQSSTFILVISIIVTGVIMVMVLLIFYFKIYLWPEYKHYFETDSTHI